MNLKILPAVHTANAQGRVVKWPSLTGICYQVYVKPGQRSTMHQPFLTGTWMGKMELRIYLLGQFKLLADDRRIELPSRPAQSLLAYLALNAGVIQRREKLASLLWPEATETNARSYLRQALWRVRKALQDGSLSGEDSCRSAISALHSNDQSDYWLDAAYSAGDSRDSVDEKNW